MNSTLNSINRVLLTDNSPNLIIVEPIDKNSELINIIGNLNDNLFENITRYFQRIHGIKTTFFKQQESSFSINVQYQPHLGLAVGISEPVNLLLIALEAYPDSFLKLETPNFINNEENKKIILKSMYHLFIINEIEKTITTKLPHIPIADLLPSIKLKTNQKTLTSYKLE